MRTLALAVPALAFLLAACSHSASSAQNTSSSSSSGANTTGTTTSASATTDASDASSDTAAAAAACGGHELPTGFECAQTPSGPAPVLSRAATAGTDGCRAAVCPGGARCESSPHGIGGRDYKLPRCVTTGGDAGGTAPGGPMRDPCARFACPLGYQCTAPADAPYCVPANW